MVNKYASFLNRWCLVRADPVDILQMSWGEVASIEDLYRPSIFGPRQDLTCECGAMHGPGCDGMPCANCGVVCTSDSAFMRRTQFGVIKFDGFVTYPLGPEDAGLARLPVLPIAYRIDRDGNPNGLGRKYEALVRATSRWQTRPGARNLTEFVFEPDERRVVLNDLFGAPADGVPRAEAFAREDTLLGLLGSAILGLDVDLDTIVRALGCKLKISATI